MTKLLYILFGLMATAFIVGATYYVIKPPSPDKTLVPRLTPSPTPETEFQEGFFNENAEEQPAESPAITE